MGGCDLTSLGTSAVAPPVVGDDSSCHSSPEPPCQLSTDWGPGGGSAGSPLEGLVPVCLRTSIASLAATPRGVGEGGMLLGTWVLCQPLTGSAWNPTGSPLCPMHLWARRLRACIGVSGPGTPLPLLLPRLSVPISAQCPLRRAALCTFLSGHVTSPSGYIFLCRRLPERVNKKRQTQPWFASVES